MQLICVRRCKSVCPSAALWTTTITFSKPSLFFFSFFIKLTTNWNLLQFEKKKLHPLYVKSTSIINSKKPGMKKWWIMMFADDTAICAESGEQTSEDRIECSYLGSAIQSNRLYPDVVKKRVQTGLNWWRWVSRVICNRRRAGWTGSEMSRLGHRWGALAWISSEWGEVDILFFTCAKKKRVDKWDKGCWNCRCQDRGKETVSCDWG